MSIDSIHSVTSPYTGINPTQSALASGKQINTAADNPAGLAMVNAMNSQVMAQSVSMRNANDGMGLLQTADGASQSFSVNMQRMYDLSLQASNGTLNPAQRNHLNTEFQQGLKELDRIATTTQFNGMNLLNGELNAIQIALGDSQSELSLPNLQPNALGLANLDLNNPANAGLAMQALQTAGEFMGEVRAQFGAQQNGLVSAFNNMANTQINTIGSRSQIEDTDVAKAASEQSRDDVLNRAAIMMLSIGNQERSNTLQLLS
ncbi:MAG: flagellin [Thiomicrospira sp.]|jgi:flagellin|nr:flagellin [Thiomicrospira sp.]